MTKLSPIKKKKDLPNDKSPIKEIHTPLREYFTNENILNYKKNNLNQNKIVIKN